ncbi:hypothetical protein HDU85_003393 [Gaertneriomyces sp. JEL0708]|nr:hypothetical protein HDU85_003393 [Gaertneriomyces sp. JEL0708]
MNPKHDRDGNVRDNTSNAATTKIEKILLSCSLILPVVPQIMPFAVQAVESARTIFETACTSDLPAHRLRNILRALYRFLRYDASTFAPLLSWTPLYTAVRNTDERVRAYAAHMLAILLEMSDGERQAFIGHHVHNEELQFLALLEDERDTMERGWMFIEEEPITIDGQNSRTLLITSDSLSSLTTSIAGVLLPISTTTPAQPTLVPTATTQANLHRLALAISLNVPVLLSGPPGCGKTALIAESANYLYATTEDLLKIHLGDQTDAKVLLGTYVCTSEPGVFRWQPGVLTTAVMEGRWILFEDIDLAPTEVLSVLVPLLETGWLMVAGRGEKVKAKPGFRVFGTQSLTKGKANRMAGQAGEGLWHAIDVEELSKSEVQEVIEKKFPGVVALGAMASGLSCYWTLVDTFADKAFSNARLLSLRDLMKFCDRVESWGRDMRDALEVASDGSKQLKLEVRELLFLEAADSYARWIPKRELSDRVLAKIGEAFNVPLHRVQFFIDHFTPAVTSTDEQVIVGRARLPKRPRDLLDQRVERPFASTPPTLRLMSTIASCLAQSFPTLLVGETGTGKTTLVQHLAHMTNTPLTVINLSQQSDSSDLLGGFKPVDCRVLAGGLVEEFDKLFTATFSAEKNQLFLDGVRKGVRKSKWAVVVKGWKKGLDMAMTVFRKARGAEVEGVNKRRKKFGTELEDKWKEFGRKVEQFDQTQQKSANSLLFSFLEGALVQAMRKGEWVLLDEINLATPETLDCLAGLLSSKDSGLVLVERGDTRSVERHPSFRLLGCMNPSGDAGKRDLPPGLRARFTEVWCPPPDASLEDLVLIIRGYLTDVLPPTSAGTDLCYDIARFYTAVRQMASSGELFDGAGQRVHYSLRTLTRALGFARLTTRNGTWSLRRSVWEGIEMTFGTGVEEAGWAKVRALLVEGVGKNVNLNRRAPLLENHSVVAGYMLPHGPHPIPADEQLQREYIITPAVEKNLGRLARAVMSGHPVLIQGPTSAGKTSMVEFLAKKCGRKCVRVNNHEGTEVSEYIGGWGEDGGKVVWVEGILVTALKQGHWLILDELNLAPSDVLESLNRLLDDNRELYIPETQVTIKPHPDFQLFATQNPAGTMYGGRKQLSRAFRNRFLEIGFDEIPVGELETILSRRCAVAPSQARKLVSVYKALQHTRGKGRVFEGRHGFVTLRDLFRWAGRVEKGAGGWETVAEEGWCLLGERMRSREDRDIVKDVIERELRVQLDIDSIYNRGFDMVQQAIKNSDGHGEFQEIVRSIVWTKATKRLFTLVYKCVLNCEPVLLVGETGGGKTTVCQVVAGVLGKDLKIVNAHAGSEVSDFVGGVRPVRGRQELIEEGKSVMHELLQILQHSLEEPTDLTGNLLAEWNGDLDVAVTLVNGLLPKGSHRSDEVSSLFKRLQDLQSQATTLFSWRDGPLTTAMRLGSHFLLDEISLADDSVLERLNSVLEPARFLMLAEKGKAEALYAEDGFRFLATMNPGGDYGKKELSPALRNRFCEVWVEGFTGRGDLEEVVTKKLTVAGLEDNMARSLAVRMMDFYDALAKNLGKERVEIVSLRDVLAWVQFLSASAGNIGLEEAFVQGGCMGIVDGLGVNPAFGVISDTMRKEVESWLRGTKAPETHGQIVADENRFGIDPFYVPKGLEPIRDVQFSFVAPTTRGNLFRVLRALQLHKPVLLEGSPGVGKTSLVVTLGKVCGYPVTRINLSEQTDLTDLFGTDLPVEGAGNAGRFEWRDGPFLAAMKAGGWVLLDELNLASQQVLEGLNACLDHRGEVYIPELDKSFKKGPGFRVFAAQNPQAQGGGRKGLPRSFVNRFTSVWVEALSERDLNTILAGVYGAGNLEPETLERMVRFNERMKEDTMVKMRFGFRGAPWEFNLRDVVRWVEILSTGVSLADSIKILYTSRFRSAHDRECVHHIYVEVFGDHDWERRPDWEVTQEKLRIGCAELERKANRTLWGSVPMNHLQLLPGTLPTLEVLLKCVEMNYMPIITGPGGAGKTSLVRLLAGLSGVTLKEFSLNPGVDSVELLGGFEQADGVRRRKAVIDKVGSLVGCCVKEMLKRGQTPVELVTAWDMVTRRDGDLDMVYVAGFVDELAKLTVSLDIDVSEKAVPSLESIFKAIELYKETLIGGATGTFEWIDGSLIRAMEEGHWILLDNVNLCPSSVLDRLNPLLESGGVLAVTERGLVDGEIQIVGKRSGFRIFMCMDERFGEISRAMRNRGVEVYVEGLTDVPRLLRSAGLPGKLRVSGTEQHLTDPRRLRRLARLTVERIERGEDMREALAKSVRDVWSTDVKAELQMNDGTGINTLLEVGEFPHYINSRWVMEHSNLANLLLDSSVLEYLLLGGDFHGEFSRDKLLEAAISVFVTNSVSNRHLRRSWFTTIMPRLMSGDSTPLHLLGSTLEGDSSVDLQAMARKVEDHSGRKLCLSGTVADKLILMNELGNPDFEAIKAEYTHALDDWSVASRLRIMIYKQDDATTIRTESLSVIQKSKLFANYKLGENELGHDCVRFLWPFFEQLRRVATSWAAAGYAENVHQILDHSARLWDTLLLPDLDFDSSLIALRRLCKALGRCPPYNGDDIESTRLRACVDNLATTSGMISLERVGMLWRHGSITTLKDASLADIERRLCAVNKHVEPDWTNLFHPSLLLDDASKRALVEGVATLYFLNEGKIDQSLLDVIVEVSGTLEGRVAGIQKQMSEERQRVADGKVVTEESLVQVKGRIPLTMMCKVAERGARVLQWALVDQKMVKDELPILGSLCAANHAIALPDVMKGVEEKLRLYYNIALSSSSRSPCDLEPLQRILWACDAEAGHSLSASQLAPFVRTVAHDALYRWHRALWSNAASFWAEAMARDELVGFLDGAIVPIISDDVEIKSVEGKFAGPTILNKSTLSAFSWRLLASCDGVPLYAFNARAAHAKMVSEIVTWNESGSHWKDDVVILANALLEFLRDLRRAFSQPVHAEIMSSATFLLREDASTSKSDIASLSLLLAKADDAQLSKSFVEYLVPCIELVVQLIHASDDQLASRGKAWMLYSFIFLRCYIPDVPVDPALGPTIKLNFMRNAEQSIEAEIIVRRQLELLHTGNMTNPLIDALRENMQYVSRHQAKWSSKVALRPERSQMSEILGDLRLLKDHLLSPTAVSDILRGLSDAQLASGKEMHLQDTLASLVERLEMKFPLYRDILQPIYLRVYQFKYGLRMFSESSERSDANVERALSALSKFVDDQAEPDRILPLLKSLDGLNRGTVFVDVLATLLHRVAALSEVMAPTCREYLEHVHFLFAELVDAWSELEEQRLATERAADELYKFKETAHELAGEDEIQEAHFLERFPDFREEFVDVLNSDESDIKTAKPNGSKQADLGPKSAQEARLLHRRLVAAWLATEGNVHAFTKSWETAYVRSFKAASAVANSTSYLPRQSIAQIFKGGQVFMAARQVQICTPADAGDDGSLPLDTQLQYDFYKDPNVAEANLLFSVVQSFDARVGELLSQWPEHAVLLSLSMLCERITSFAVTSPVMKLLTGLELLLQQSQDWEAYASREVSLKKCIDEVVKLILRWRKLELKCWKQLLSVEDLKCEQNASKLWFHLWKVIMGVTVQATVTELEDTVQNDTKLVEELLQMLDQFCLSSSLGEFATRLDMVHTFHQHLTALSNHQSLSPPRRKRVLSVANVLYNVHRYYKLFVSDVAGFIERLRKPILKELNGYVQIATWKDVNVFALKESATRTHHHLNKFVKKYKEILDMPVRDAMVAYHEGMTGEIGLGSGKVDSVVTKLKSHHSRSISKLVPAIVTKPAAHIREEMMLFKVDHLAERMRKHAATSVIDDVTVSDCASLDEFCATIIARIKDFQEVNASLEPGSKAAKGQKAARKKALVDLLKYLSKIGLSPRCTHRYMEQQHSAFLFALPEVHVQEQTLIAALGRDGWLTTDTARTWHDADEYFYKVVARVSKVRELQINASQDLTRPEVEKGMSYLDHILHLAIEERIAIATFMGTYERLARITSQLRQVYEDSGPAVAGEPITATIATLCTWLDRATATVTQGLMLHNAHAANRSTAPEAGEFLRKLQKTILNLKKSINEEALYHLTMGGSYIAPQGFAALLQQLCSAIENACEESSNVANEFPELAYIFQPIVQSMDLGRPMAQKVHVSGSNEGNSNPDIASTFVQSLDEVVKRLLIAFQITMGKSDSSSVTIADDGDMDEFELGENHMRHAHKRSMRLLQPTPVSALVASLTSAISSFERLSTTNDDRDQYTSLLRQTYPLVHQYLLVAQHRLFEVVLQHKTTLKLGYVLCNTFGQLFKNGYCVPKTEQPDDEEGDTDDNVAGTGIGEGEGNKDVSDEIENEGQVEGMQNDAPAAPEPQKKIDDEENGIEMDMDFEGKLEDVEADDDDEDTEQPGDEEEPEEQMGDLDGNANVIDEKLWGDEDDHGKDDKDEKTEKDAPVQSGGNETEMAAKEDASADAEDNQEKPEQKKERENKNDSKPESQGDEGEEEGDENPINDNAEDNQEENHGIDVKPADERDNDNAEPQDEGDLDLPDDMDLDGEADDDTDEAEKPSDAHNGFNDVVDMDMPDDMNMDMNESTEEQEPENTPDEQNGTDEGDTAEGEEKLEAEALAEQEEQLSEEDPGMEQEENRIQETPAHGYNEEQQDVEEDDREMENPQAVDDQLQKSAQPFGVDGTTGEKTAANLQEEPGSAEQPTEEGQEGHSTQDASHGQDTRQKQTASEPPKDNQQGADTDPNPRRSIGDALKQWMSRLKSIRDATKEDAPVENEKPKMDETETTGDQAGEFEFVENDNEAADGQAMADATVEQLNEVDRKALADDKEDKTYAQDDMEVDSLDAAEDNPNPEDTNEKPLPDSAEREKAASKKPTGAIDIAKDDQSPDKPTEGKTHREDVDNADQMDMDDEHMQEDEEPRLEWLDEDKEYSEEGHEAMTSEEYDELRKDLEQSIAAWRESGQDPREAQDLWRNYTVLTRDLSFSLCEQLRLILEPTLATKLKGDYRTGKRLNMRKIIPYIASRFKKDKIWLRRTKPSKRTYQIMISIDDSRSMAESRCVQLAYESLSVITTALTQLEAGDVSVISFGEDVKLLHPFDRPFSDEAGAEVIRRFTFGQDRTNVRKMMDTAMGILEQARSMASSGQGADLWQLQLILSDGICEDHEVIRSLVRRAAEQRVMVVFIVLDNRQEKDSIAKMTNVTYSVDANGKPVLQMNRYMDTFPFDYYVVVKDIGTLPEVLADTLRQYFMYTSQ